MQEKINRKCECCGAGYASGKDYGEYWCQHAPSGLEAKGLCEFCNPNHKYFTPEKTCHNGKA